MRPISISQIVNLLSDHLGNQLHALYHWEGRSAGIDWLLLISEETSLVQLRQIWQAVLPLDSTPSDPQILLATPSTWQRHLLLDPVWGYRLEQTGQWCAGTSLPPTPQPTQHERLAYLAHELLELSGAVTASHPSVESQAQLRQLARWVRVDGSLPLPELFANLQAHWHAQTEVEKLPSFKKPDAPPLLPELQAIYEQGDRLIFVMPDCVPARWAEIPWQTIFRTLPLSYASLHLTSVSQLQLLNQRYTPIHYLLRHYTLAWGEDVLAKLPLSPTNYWQHAARFPSYLALVQLPSDYLNSSDDQLAKLIHDFQNKLQNVQLRHELMSRLLKIPRAAPPNPLPPRTADADERIAGIFYHLHWWATYYPNIIDGARDS